MRKVQFRVLCREFLFRFSDLDLFSFHEMEMVERVSSHMIKLHRGRWRRTVPSDVGGNFWQLAVEQDTAAISRQIADVILT
jgi:ABC-2 type transport system ATP-binding protein